MDEGIRMCIKYGARVGRRMVFWLLASLMGAMGAAAVAAPMPKIPFSRPLKADMWQQATKLPGIDTGPASAPVREVIFFDANCPMCARQWGLLRPYLDHVHIHWVPVAYFDGSGPGSSSARRAASILDSLHPATSLRINEQGYHTSAQRGAFPALGSIGPEMMDTLDRNMVVMKKLHGFGTPTTLIALEPGHRYVVASGVITGKSLADLMAWLQSAPAH